MATRSGFGHVALARRATVPLARAHRRNQYRRLSHRRLSEHAAARRQSGLFYAEARPAIRRGFRFQVNRRVWLWIPGGIFRPRAGGDDPGRSRFRTPSNTGVWPTRAPHTRDPMGVSGPSSITVGPDGALRGFGGDGHASRITMAGVYTAIYSAPPSKDSTLSRARRKSYRITRSAFTCSSRFCQDNGVRGAVVLCMAEPKSEKRQNTSPRFEPIAATVPKPNGSPSR